MTTNQTIYPAPSRRMIAAAGLALTCMAATEVQAQAQAVAGALPQVIISGSRQEQLSDDLPLSVDVLDSAVIERGQVRDIQDAARDLPNVSVRHAPSRFANTGPANNTGREGNAGFNIRGLGGNRVLMLVDGIRVPRSYAFGSNAFGRDYLSLDLVKRIEVVRGPVSALYGSDGMAGLVNFITYEPADFLRGASGEPRRLGGRVSAFWDGSDDGKALAATLAAGAGETAQWMVSASGRRAHGQDTRGTLDVPNLDRTVPNPQDDRDGAILGKLVLRPAAGQKHVLTAEHVERKTDVNLLSSRARLPLAGTPAQIAGAVLDERASAAMTRDRLSWDGRFALGAALADNLQAMVGVQRASSSQHGTSDLNTQPDRLRDVSYAERTWQAGLQADRTTRLSAAWTQKIIYGLDYVTSEIRNSYGGLNPLPPEVFPLKRFPDTRETTTGLFVQGDWTGARWSVLPGLRFDHFSVDVQSQAGFFPPAKTPAKSLSGSALSPKLGVMFQATPHWGVFGNYAHGFRAPNANQVNGYYENSAEQVVIVPNPDLQPEKSRSIELGVRGRADRLSLDVAVFSGRYTNLIVDNVLLSGRGVAGDPKLFQTRNIERARIRGFEIKGSLDAGTVAGGRLGVPFAYGQARGKNSTTGNPLNSVDPAHLLVGLEYRMPSWDIRLDVRHHAAKNAEDIDSPSLVKAPNTQVSLPSATTLDLSAQWRLRKDLRLTASLVNLTNRKYWLWPDVQGLAAATTALDAYSQPGRHGKISLVADF